MQYSNNHRNSLKTKYQTLYKKVKRAIHNGRFERYTSSKKSALLRRLGRYERRLLQKGVAVAGIAALMLHVAPLQAQVPAPTGAEFRVNETTTDSQKNPSIAVDSDGDFVVVWESYDQLGEESYDIYAQRYDKNGNTIGNEFRVNSTTNNTQINPSVEMDSDGNFVIAWQSNGQDGDRSGIYAQRYNSDGTKNGVEFQVNSYTTGFQRLPSTAVDRDGNFIIAWQSRGQDGSGYGVYAQRYKRDGTTDGGEFLVNTTTTDYQVRPSVAIDNDGDFIIAWQSNGQDGSDYGIYAQRYKNDGSTDGIEFQVNTYTTDSQRSPSIGIDNDGDFILTWESYAQDGDRFGIYAQRYDRNGSIVGSEFQVNTYTTGTQDSPSVIVDSDGDFVIVWQSGYFTGSGQDGDRFGIYAQRYSKNSSTTGAEFQVNTYTTDSQLEPSIGIDDDGDFVIAWQSRGQDGSSYGIYAQRYENALPFKSDEFRVNTTTISSQNESNITVDNDGNFIVVWESLNQAGGDSYDIYAQRYDKHGNVVGDEFRVNTYTTFSQRRPSIAMDNDGDFIIAWQSGYFNSSGQDGDRYGIYAQRYNSDGTTNGGEFQVNTYTTSFQRFPSVALDSNGDFVITWQSNGQDGDVGAIYARRYTNSGSNPEPEFQVNTYTTSSQNRPSIGIDNDGNFIIAWQSFDQDGSDYGIYAQRYKNDGSTDGIEFQVNTYTTGDQQRPSIAIDDNGDFIVVWESSDQDGDSYGIYARRYTNGGNNPELEFQVNTYTTSYQRRPSIGIDNDGNFIIAWQSFDQEGAVYGIYAQRYDNNENTVDDEFQVNTYTTASQSNPSIGLDNDGDFIIAWQSYGQDGSDNGIYARRYEDVELPQGVESLVNTYTTNNQSNPKVAMDSDGDYVIVWRSTGQDGGDVNDIYAQRYNKDGSTAGTEFRVNTFTTGNQSDPSVAMDDTGAFVVAWSSFGQTGGDFNDIYIRRYDNTGMATSNVEVQVNTFTTGNQNRPNVGVDSDGDFIVVWESENQTGGDGFDVYARRYSKEGTAGTEFLVNSTTASNQRFPNVGMDSDGDFVVTWASGSFSLGSSYDVYARRYTNSGSTPGAEFQVNTFTTDTQFRSKVAVDKDGDFVIVWDSFGQDGSSSGVYARRYDNTGNPVEGEFLVNCYTTGYQGASNVGMDSDGDFVITWSSGYQDGSSYGIYAQRYDSNGDLIGEEFLVNSFTSNSQFGSSIGVDSDGDFVIAWQSGIFSGLGQDGSGTGIYAQRYQGNKSTTVCQTTLDLPNETITIDTKYQAEQSITSQQVLAAPDAIISYTATNNITLKTGFHAQPGVNFTAKIAPVNCSSSLNEKVVENRTEELTAAPTAEVLSVLLAPNPVSELLQLRLDSQVNGKAAVQIIDLNGRIVLFQALHLSVGQQIVQLDVSQLAAGTYFLKVQVSEGITQSKFVKLQH